LKLNRKNQILLCADDVNILGGSVHIILEHMKWLLVTIKEIGLDLYAEKCNSCLEIRKQNEFTILKIIIINFKERECSNIWGQM
jgi:hypothetical protein